MALDDLVAWLRREINDSGLRFREAIRDGDSEDEWRESGRIDAWLEVLSLLGYNDADLAQLEAFAKGTDDG